jgi:hypothetical protein
MTRARGRWKKVAIAGVVLLAVLIVAGAIADSCFRATERTYYGPHSDLLRVGERVTLSQDFAPTRGAVIAKAQTGIAQEEPAWDEDSCDPDRPIKIAVTSGESISVPRHLLHR